jgi:hypothetical protein
MQKIRKSVFETNSSSAHSLSVVSDTIKNYCPIIVRGGELVLVGGEYGWGVELLTDSYEKANYCAVALHYGWRHYVYDRCNIVETYEVADYILEIVKKIFEIVLMRETGCKRIKYDFALDWIFNNTDDDLREAYIDHQSQYLLYEELKNNDCLILNKDKKEFTVDMNKTDEFFTNLIFNKNSSIKISNDNNQ